MVAFDTLKASRRLRDAGFEEQKAEALVNAFAEDIGANLATKDDIALLRKELIGEIDALRKDTASGFAAVRQEMASGFAAVRQEAASENESLRKDMASGFEALRQEMTSGFAAVRQEMASENESLRKDMALLDQRATLRIALAIGSATTALLAAMGILAGIIISRL